MPLNEIETYDMDVAGSGGILIWHSFTYGFRYKKGNSDLSNWDLSGMTDNYQSDFNPDFGCICCNQPVESLSICGPLICPSCDCGNNRDTGENWTSEEFIRIQENVRYRLKAFDVVKK